MNDNKLERVLSVEGAAEFKMLLSRRTNVKISRYFEEVIQAYLEDFNKPTTRKDLTDPQWCLTRAYQDGGRYYLDQLLDLFKEK